MRSLAIKTFMIAGFKTSETNAQTVHSCCQLLGTLVAIFWPILFTENGPLLFASYTPTSLLLFSIPRSPPAVAIAHPTISPVANVHAAPDIVRANEAGFRHAFLDLFLRSFAKSLRCSCRRSNFSFLSASFIRLSSNANALHCV